MYPVSERLNFEIFGCNIVVIELCVMQFCSEIILVISNQIHAACSFNFLSMHMISNLIVHMQKFQCVNWLRTRRLIQNSARS